MENEILKDVLGCVNFEKLLIEVALTKHIKPRLQALVENTENKFDDAALAMAMPVIEGALRDLLDKLPK